MWPLGVPTQLILSAIAFGVSVSVANAVPLNYQEGIDGDLFSGSSLSFDFGTNTVQGSSSLDFEPPALITFDPDSFQFSLPSGGTLSSVTYSFDVGSSANFQSVTGPIFGGFVSPSVTIDLFGLSPVNLTPTSPSASPQSVQQLNDFALGSIDLEFPSSIDWSYIWTFEVVADQPVGVPEPASFALIAAGLIGYAVLARRRRRPG